MGRPPFGKTSHATLTDRVGPDEAPVGEAPSRCCHPSGLANWSGPATIGRECWPERLDGLCIGGMPESRFNPASRGGRS